MKEGVTMMWGYGWGWPGFLMMGIGGLLWIALLGLAIWALVRLLSNRTPVGNPPVSGPSSMEILRQRYARGEIDEATFARMREQLEGGQNIVTNEIRPPNTPTGSMT
jgi:putative membrane protein